MTDPATVEKVARANCRDAYSDPHAWEAQSEAVRDMYRRDARVMIPAYEQAIKDAGMVVVPREATDAMRDYALDLWEFNGVEDPRDIYRAMISAFEAADLASARGEG